MSTTTGAPLRVPRRHDPALTIWTVAGLCWVGTVVLALTGGHELAHHDAVLEESTLAWPLRITAFLAVWLVMVAAMMLPTVMPLVRLFGPVSARAPRPRAARAGFYLGYLTVWTAFGPVALFGDAGIHRLVDTWPWLDERSGLVLAATLALAGAFQFSPLKNRCLSVCRDPASFLWQHYRRGAGGGWRLGLGHGLYCLGCCWALMLVMFAVGVSSLAWMLALTGVMLVEKTTRFGARLVAPVGVALLAGAAVVAVPALL
ncbi:MAG TPA: DUF2182 domain-containing protein [Actinomycetospora sp.]|uniref:DUF2182 domain-containing protein n=1 Tax=Actinomycetospora sp. TaxID=1872135 RepID=UPI002F401653